LSGSIHKVKVRVTQIHLQGVYCYLCGVFEKLSNTKSPQPDSHLSIISDPIPN